MKYKKHNVYLIPGMAAGAKSFQNIHFPEEQFSVEIIEWLIPEEEESLKHYAERMAKRVTKPNPILVGVSFGGVVVQEMKSFLKPRLVIIISSVKSKYELPRRMRITSFFKIYKIIPTKHVLSSEDLTKFSVGPKSKKRLRLYQEYLDVREPEYLDWAIKEMVSWKRKEVDLEVIHFHGDKDEVFPLKYIAGCNVITNGTHIMLLTKGREISIKLQEVIGS